MLTARVDFQALHGSYPTMLNMREPLRTPRLPLPNASNAAATLDHPLPR